MEKKFIDRHGLTPQWGQHKCPALFAVGIQLPEQSEEDVAESMAELCDLVKTAGGRVVGSLVQKREQPDRHCYLGKGKMQEAGEAARKAGAIQIVTDDELSGLQLRQMEEGTGFPVIDRTRLILEIFARHATTREGILQVELAHLQYVLLRLAGGYEGFSRQRGGIGTKGPGETQIETDRRRLRLRIQKLNKELKEVVRTRDIQRRKRAERFTPLFALVGYTNAGKSTLLNALSGSNVLTNDGLFTTLDPTARKVDLPGGLAAILSDTVGFIRKLPHGLVKAFRATLENVVQSQVLIHVCDVSDPSVRKKIEAVEDVLREIDALSLERLMVFNKIDLTPGNKFEALRHAYPNAVFLSARTGEGLEILKRRIAEILARDIEEMELAIPQQEPILREILAIGKPRDQQWIDGKVCLKVALPRRFAQLVEKFRIHTDSSLLICQKN